MSARLGQLVYDVAVARLEAQVDGVGFVQHDGVELLVEHDAGRFTVSPADLGLVDTTPQIADVERLLAQHQPSVEGDPA